MNDTPVLYWLRRDLRLADNPALVAAAADGRPVIPVFILDPETETLGAAARWRLGLGLAALDASLRQLQSRIVFRRGPALTVLSDLISETGAGAVHWNRSYDPAARARDQAVKAALRARGLQAESHNSHLLFEPWTVETGTGGFYRVYSPFWRAVKDRPVPAPLAPPAALRSPAAWPVSARLEDWRLGEAMNRGADVVAQHVHVGEDRALARRDLFLERAVGPYRDRRDYPGEPATSGLSENLTYGEIGPRQIWHAAMRARHEGAPGAEHFLKELVWREFAYHLMFHTPHLLERNWREEWDGFPWQGDNEAARRWRQGMTGVPFVDAAMRELYVTGTMHNRARMIAASYLTKHLMTDWRIGLDWFADCLIDWDPASNALGWQWVAGSGPDAAPYFRIFNPDTQAQKFDADEAYRRRFLAELSPSPGRDALDFFRAVPRSWGLDPARPYPRPVVALDAGRARALAAYEARRP
ncbi:cryptochrome/photolyase family protein [Plastorhodobacter daqingensis]|uniref:Cryptochrome/photolyase family protein n=1 Tax=Plastorhodobacter daqingensis TaxID=1387281 RepID=A0ABW2UHG6_9RHOB